jgi:hypothetical protein
MWGESGKDRDDRLRRESEKNRAKDDARRAAQQDANRRAQDRNRRDEQQRRTDKDIDDRHHRERTNKPWWSKYK